MNSPQNDIKAKAKKLTGMEFSFQEFQGSARLPFGPSVDRVDNSRGYIKGNIRVTTVMANLARSDFPDQIFLQMCRMTTDNKLTAA